MGWVVIGLVLALGEISPSWKELENISIQSRRKFSLHSLTRWEKGAGNARCLNQIIFQLPFHQKWVVCLKKAVSIFILQEKNQKVPCMAVLDCLLQKYCRWQSWLRRPCFFSNSNSHWQWTGLKREFWSQSAHTVVNILVMSRRRKVELPDVCFDHFRLRAVLRNTALLLCLEVASYCREDC